MVIIRVAVPFKEVASCWGGRCVMVIDSFIACRGRVHGQRLFADDCLLYRHIRNDKDSVDLQTDLTALEDWETKWQVCFHPEKCTVIRVCTSKGLRKNTSYKLHDHVLDVVDCNKYLGVNISKGLNWKKHVDYTAAKASRTLGFLRRNLRDCS